MSADHTRPCSSAVNTLRLFLLLVCVSLSSCLTSARGEFVSSVASSQVVFNVSATLPASSEAFHDFLPAGWSRESLCASGGVSDVAECGLVMRLVQESPAPSTGCGAAVVLQVACLASSSTDLTNMLCISADPTTNELVFPQDAAAGAWTSTLPERIAVAGAQPAPASASSPSTATALSPARLAALESIATRNAIAANFTRLSVSLPLRVAVVVESTSSDSCPTVSYTVTLEVTRNSACASAWFVPEHEIIVPPTTPTTNGTINNGTVIIVPGSNSTTPVPCLSPYGACLTTTSGGGVNYTSVCACDAGFGSGASGQDCFVELATDFTVSAQAARPFNPEADLDPLAASMLWTNANNFSLKGSVSEMLNIALNQSTAAELSSKLSEGDWTESSTVSDDGTTPFAAYWFGRVNVSQSVSDLSLVVHITVHDAESATMLPVQLQLGTRFYPTLSVHTPLACLNTSANPGLAKATSSSSSSSAASKAFVFELTSCATLAQSFPTSVLSSSASSRTAFKVLIDPPTVAGIVDAALSVGGGGATNENQSVPIYFSLFFQAPLTIDVRVWFQEDLDIWTPQSATTSSASTLNIIASPRTLVASTASVATTMTTPASSSSHPAGALYAASSSLIPWQNQSWVQHLLPSESVFFHLNDSGTPLADGTNEFASLYVLVNDTACAAGLMTSGFFAPHWWHSANFEEALAAGLNISAPLTPATPPIADAITPMAIAGGCVRPTERFLGTPASEAGFFGQVFSVCETWLEINVWHMPPLALVRDMTHTRDAWHKREANGNARSRVLTRDLSSPFALFLSLLHSPPARWMSS